MSGLSVDRKLALLEEIEYLLKEMLSLAARSADAGCLVQERTELQRKLVLLQNHLDCTVDQYQGEEHLMKEKGTLYFFTGLAGAGKTTIGSLFYERLRERNPDAVLMDGDRRRRAWVAQQGENSGTAEINDDNYTTEARRSGAIGMFRQCRDLTEQGVDVVCCSISMYKDVRQWNRENIENYVEIYIRTAWETLLRRDQKGLYSQRRKNVVGVDLPWDEPESPHIVIQNDGDIAPEEIVEKLVQGLLNPCKIIASSGKNY